MKLGRYFVGLISGLTFGMLFAPKKGKSFREELVKKSGHSSHDALMLIFNAFKDAGMDAATEMKKLSENEQFQSVLSVSKEKMHDYLSELEGEGYDMAARAQEKMEEWGMAPAESPEKLKKNPVKVKKAVTQTTNIKLKKVDPLKSSQSKLTKKGALKKKGPSGR